MVVVVPDSMRRAEASDSRRGGFGFDRVGKEANQPAMIHYHGVPCSGPRDLAQRFYVGRHAMVSYAYREHLPLVADVCQSFVLDNGAYTTWKSGEQFDFDGYLAWCDEWQHHPGCDWFLAPDVIDGDERENDELLNRFMARLGLSAPFVPVWHLHESVHRLQRLAGIFRRVALGSSGKWRTPGTEAWWDRMAEAMSAVTFRGGQPTCKLHGLRMLSTDIFPRLPLASADSTNAAVNGGATNRFGMYPSPIAADRANVIANRIESFNSAAVWERHDVTEEALFAHG